MLCLLHGPFQIRNFPIFMETPEQDMQPPSKAECTELQLETNILKWCTVHVCELVVQEGMAIHASAHHPSFLCPWCSLSWLLSISSSTLIPVWQFQSHLPPNSTSKWSYLYNNCKYHPQLLFSFLVSRTNDCLSLVQTMLAPWDWRQY